MMGLIVNLCGFMVCVMVLIVFFFMGRDYFMMNSGLLVIFCGIFIFISDNMVGVMLESLLFLIVFMFLLLM